MPGHYEARNSNQLTKERMNNGDCNTDTGIDSGGQKPQVQPCTCFRDMQFCADKQHKTL